MFSAPRQVRFLLLLLFSLLIVVPLQTDLRDLWVVQQAEAGEVVRLKQVGVGAKKSAMRSKAMLLYTIKEYKALRSMPFASSDF